MTTTFLAEAVVIDTDLLTNIRPMADLWDPIERKNGPAYLISAFRDGDDFIRRNRVHFSVLARNLAPVLFPEA
jgi:hypothetical protein